MITPNIPEAEILSNTKILTIEDMVLAANKLLNFGAKNILIKGGHIQSKLVTDIFLNKNEIAKFHSKRHNTKNTHGTGCTLSSAVATFYSCGKTLKKSCELAINYVNHSIKNSPNFGKGNGPINHLASIKVDKKYL